MPPSRGPFRRVDAASLGLFRVAFGLILLWEVARYVRNGWIVSIHVAPPFHFHWPGLEWVRPWPGAGMHVHFLLLAIAAAFVAVGRMARPAAAVLAVGWAFVLVVERGEYLNHVYLICLVALLLACVPCDRAFRIDRRLPSAGRPETVPAWALWLLRFQIALPYLYGGIAKLNGDFVRGEPLGLWTSRMVHLHSWIPGLGNRELALALSWLATAFDLAVVPLLLWRRTRVWAFAAATLFHLGNAAMFRIGIFPWMMIAATTLFLPPDWPRVLARRWNRGDAAPPASGTAPVGAVPSAARRRATLGLLAVWVAVQLLVPLRHLLIPGRVDWTEEGYHFSWRMMLNDKAAAMRFVARDPATGREFPLDPRDLGLTPRHVEKLGQEPELLRQFARHAREVFAARGTPGIEVRATVLCSLNGRRPQYLVDPTVDLAGEEPTWRHAEWIVPLVEPLPEEPWLTPPKTWERAVAPWEEWKQRLRDD